MRQSYTGIRGILMFGASLSTLGRLPSINRNMAYFQGWTVLYCIVLPYNMPINCVVRVLTLSVQIKNVDEII